MNDKEGNLLNVTLVQESVLLLDDLMVNLQQEQHQQQLEESNNFIANDSFSFNSSFNTSSVPWYEDVPYPGSGYTQLGIILLAFFITCIMILIVVGNLLVCIAISTEKSLKTVQNWFIASLAVSDLLLGLIIMPFSLAYELMGYWIFGNVWCEVCPCHVTCQLILNNLCNYSVTFFNRFIMPLMFFSVQLP